MDAKELMNYQNALQQIEDQKKKIEHLEKEFNRKFKEWENQRDTIEKMNIQINELKEKFMNQMAYLNKISNLNTSIVGIIEG